MDFLTLIKNMIMKNFIKNNFTIIVLVISLLAFLKSCNDSRKISEIQKEIKSIKDSTYTKTELGIQLKISGLEAEKRMIQATDRKMLDVQRQTQIEEEIKQLKLSK
jgi:CRISPR/Cas system-associated protein Csx1